MKRTRTLVALLAVLALCLGMLAGCGKQDADADTAEETQNAGQETQDTQDTTEPETQDADDVTEPDTTQGETEGEITAEMEAEGAQAASNAVYHVGDLEITQVNDDISTMTYTSCNGKEMTVPVLNNANWDNTQIAEDKSFVETTNTTGEEMTNLEGSYYCTYFSEEQDYYDLDDMAQQYSDVFDNPTIYPKTSSEDGSVQAVAIHGTYQGWEIYQYLITVDYEDEYAVLDLSFYTDDPAVAQPILSYYNLPDPVSAQ